MRIVTSLLALVGAALAVELAVLARVAIRQQSAAAAANVRVIKGSAVPAMGMPDESGAILERVVPAVEIPRTSLDKALDQLAAQAGVRLTVASGSLATQSDDPVEAHLGRVTIRDALKTLLKQVKPSPPFSAEGQLIIVGAENMETRLYDLRPLMPPDAIGTAPEKLAAMDRLSEGLVNAVITSTASDEWRENGGKGSVSQWNGVLVVHETPRVHRQVARLLSQLAFPQFAPLAAVTQPSSDASIWRVPTSVEPAVDADAILERIVPKIDIAPSPLGEALQAFSRQTGIHVALQDGLIEESAGDTSFEAHLHDATVVDALRAILQPMSPPVPFCARGDGLLVGWAGVPYLKIYDVRPLLPPFYQPASNAPSGARAAYDAYDDLLQTIIRSVDTDTWAETGGTGKILYWNGMFLIEQTALIHHDVARLLTEMRRATAEPGNASPAH